MGRQPHAGNAPGRTEGRIAVFLIIGFWEVPGHVFPCNMGSGGVPGYIFPCNMGSGGVPGYIFHCNMGSVEVNSTHIWCGMGSVEVNRGYKRIFGLRVQTYFVLNVVVAKWGERRFLVYRLILDTDSSISSRSKMRSLLDIS